MHACRGESATDKAALHAAKQTAGSLQAEGRNSRLRSLGVLLPFGCIFEAHGVGTLLQKRGLRRMRRRCRRVGCGALERRRGVLLYCLPQSTVPECQGAPP